MPDFQYRVVADEAVTTSNGGPYSSHPGRTITLEQAAFALEDAIKAARLPGEQLVQVLNGTTFVGTMLIFQSVE